MSAGMNMEEAQKIADKMNLSTRTIDRRIRSMKEKLNM